MKRKVLGRKYHKKEKRKTLGKGLNTFKPDDYSILKDNPRLKFDQKYNDELVKSIKATGILRPITPPTEVKYNKESIDELSKSIMESGIFEPITQAPEVKSNKESIDELSKSIMESGILKPVLITPETQ